MTRAELDLGLISIGRPWPTQTMPFPRPARYATCAWRG
jgi:hypothetical protein